jgi:hypothetical protein
MTILVYLMTFVGLFLSISIFFILTFFVQAEMSVFYSFIFLITFNVLEFRYYSKNQDLFFGKKK